MSHLYLNNFNDFNHIIKMQIHKTKSEIKTVVCGIPQGSVHVLSHLLFILYIYMTTVTIAGKNVAELINILNTELQKLNSWLHIKGFNYSKFLGVIIDDGLKWTNHISYIKNKIAKGFGIILRVDT